MPKTKSAKEALKNFKDQYGEEEGERIYYSTAKKQGRNPDTFKKESLKLVDDIVIENNDSMVIIPKGTVVYKGISETVGSGAIAMIPNALNIDDEDDEDDEEEVEEASNSQISTLNLDY